MENIIRIFENEEFGKVRTVITVSYTHLTLPTIA